MTEKEKQKSTDDKIEKVVKNQEQDDKTNKEHNSTNSDTQDNIKKSPTKKLKEEKAGIAHVYSSGNNTAVHITDLAGNTISRVTGGMVTKHSRLKSNPTIAMFVGKKVAERPKDLGITSLYIRTKGKTATGNTGPGSHAAIKALGKEFRIINILDTMKIARGGPKKKGGKRGRRV